MRKGKGLARRGVRGGILEESTKRIGWGREKKTASDKNDLGRRLCGAERPKEITDSDGRETPSPFGRGPGTKHRREARKDSEKHWRSEAARRERAKEGGEWNYPKESAREEHWKKYDTACQRMTAELKYYGKEGVKERSYLTNLPLKEKRGRLTI